jgi:hypothetical protein
MFYFAHRSPSGPVFMAFKPYLQMLVKENIMKQLKLACQIL